MSPLLNLFFDLLKNTSEQIPTWRSNAVLLNTGPGGPYFKRGHLRTDIPTGQFALQSNYFHNLDLTASATYSSASSDFLNFNEFMHGSTATLNSGSPNTDRVSANADFGVTLHLTKRLSISDKFRWLNWREPGAFTNTAFNCVLASGAALAGPTGFPAGAVTPTALRNPCNSDILTLTGLTASGNATSGSYEAITSYNSMLGEDSYFNTLKLNWQPSHRLSGYIGYRYGHRQVRDGNLGVGVYNQVTTTFTNNGTGTIPAPTVTTSVGAVDKEEINLHTALLGVVVRPVEAWRINGDLELLYADNSFTLITPRHQQRARLYTNFKVNRWMSLNGGLHFVETRNGFAAGDTVENLSGTIAANVGGPLFPAGFTSAAYGHKDHWRYYTFGTSINPNSKFTFDLGWTLLDQDIKSATCLPLSGTGGVFGGTVTAPATCNNATTARAFLQDFQESTNSAYTNISFRPTKRVTLSIGYEVTQDNGHTNWRRLDDGTNLQVVGDIFGNSPPLAGNPISPCPLGSAGAAVGCIFPGPFPDQPLGPQAINWHKGSAGLAFEVVKGVEFKGLWSYYDYNGKDHSPALALLTVTSRRDFHANVGTLSLRYSF